MAMLIMALEGDGCEDRGARGGNTGHMRHTITHTETWTHKQPENT